MTATSLRVVPSAPAPARWLGRVLVGAVLVFFSVFFVLPLAWLLLAPTKSQTQLTGLNGEGPFSFGSFEQLAENWNTLVGFQDGIIWTWLGNSVLYSGVALVLTIIVTIPAGYALAMTNFKLRRLVLITTLMVMLIPNTALALPIFLELTAVHLVGTPLAVILPFAFFPFGVYLAYIYFSTTMSRDLLDAARIDGAGEFRVFTKIAMPLATPVIALVGFFNFVSNWNNYFLPFITQPGSRKMPVQVGLAELLSNTPTFNPTNVASLTISLPQLALATTHLRGSRAGRLPVLAALPGDRADGGRHEGMTGVRRFGMAARMVPEKREEYLELHRAVWPAVENTIRGVRHPQLHDLRARRRAVRLLRVRRRRLRRGPGAHGGGPVDAGVVGAHGALPAAVRARLVSARTGRSSTRPGTWTDSAVLGVRQAPALPRHDDVRRASRPRPRPGRPPRSPRARGGAR